MRRLCHNAQKVNKIILIRLTFSIQNSQMSHRAFWFLKEDGWNGGHISRGGEDDELMVKKLLIKKALQKNSIKWKKIHEFILKVWLSLNNIFLPCYDHPLCHPPYRHLENKKCIFNEKAIFFRGSLVTIPIPTSLQIPLSRWNILNYKAKTTKIDIQLLLEFHKKKINSISNYFSWCTNILSTTHGNEIALLNFCLWGFT